MIDEALKATRNNYVVWDDSYNLWGIRSGENIKYQQYPPITREEAQAECDRLNLIAVLRAIREPSKNMYIAMIDALIDEVKEEQRR